MSKETFEGLDRKMEMLVIEGGKPLSGSVSLSGSKNSSLPIVIASLLSEQTSIIENLPNLADTRFLLELLRSFGANFVLKENVLEITAERLTSNLAHYDVVRKMRASVLVLAPLLARFKKAVVSLPGGCTIGSRPVDIHLDGLRKLGALVEVKDGYIHAELPAGKFIGNEFELPLPSVGATENLIMAAVLAKGKTVLKRAAKEPEVIELCQALNSAGARIAFTAPAVIEIEGVSSLGAIRHRIKPDRIEAGTFMALAAATRSSFTIQGVCLADVDNMMQCFKETGVLFDVVGQDKYGMHDLLVKAPELITACNIETAAFPGFPTDMQAQFMAAMTVALGTSTIYERIFENRMMHVPELKRMGADIRLKNGVAQVIGQPRLTGAPVMATDLRASASLVIAALAAHGRSEIRRVYHLDRGYEALEQKLQKLSANIKRCAQTA